jgi:DNA-binding NarL/FixJ family response regulator
MKLTLTSRELQIINLLCLDYSCKEIGSKLNLSHRTVESHLEKIRFKLSVKSKIGIVVFAFKNNIITF